MSESLKRKRSDDGRDQPKRPGLKNGRQMTARIVDVQAVGGGMLSILRRDILTQRSLAAHWMCSLLLMPEPMKSVS